ncbi:MULTISPECIES: C40 family peptidase [Aquimarina]|uniref:C40 family peptidase n=1 Tax=Aquimarina TaxID=290174 RepID=UPI000D691046|nr:MULTISPECIES: C40 family peptidase [Aquimarina]
MKKTFYYLLVCLSFILYSCGSSSGRSSSKNKVVISGKTKSTSKTRTTSNPNEKTKNTSKTRVTGSSSNKKIKSIIKHAKTFSGTRYKYGGTTKKGMDCSGLVYTSFKKENVVLPRTSRTMATQGKAVSLKKVVVGDLLFFKTNKRKNVISHVGLVVETKGAIKFIHASTSRGVIISSLDEKYWNKSFAWARRVL